MLRKTKLTIYGNKPNMFKYFELVKIWLNLWENTTIFRHFNTNFKFESSKILKFFQA